MKICTDANVFAGDGEPAYKCLVYLTEQEFRLLQRIAAFFVSKSGDILDPPAMLAQEIRDYGQKREPDNQQLTAHVASLRQARAHVARAFAAYGAEPFSSPRKLELWQAVEKAQEYLQLLRDQLEKEPS
jgi:hypothetical protein